MHQTEPGPRLRRLLRFHSDGHTERKSHEYKYQLKRAKATRICLHQPASAQVCVLEVVRKKREVMSRDINSHLEKNKQENQFGFALISPVTSRQSVVGGVAGATQSRPLWMDKRTNLTDGCCGYCGSGSKRHLT